MKKFLILLSLLFWANPSQAAYTRIISLYPAHSENLLYLGAADKLIGLSKGVEGFPQLKGKTIYSYREDPEKFIAANPDLVLIRPMIERAYPLFVKKLRQAGIKVLSLQPETIADLYPYWRQLGKLAGQEQKAEQMIADFAQQVTTYQARSEAIENKPKVYFESIHRRMKTFAPDSIALFALELAGGINIAEDARQVRSTTIAEYGKEHILAHAEEIDVFLAQQGRMNPISSKDIYAEPGFMAIKAIKEKRVYLVDERLLSRPTPRILKGVATIHAYLYPNGVQP